MSSARRDAAWCCVARGEAELVGPRRGAARRMAQRSGAPPRRGAAVASRWRYSAGIPSSVRVENERRTMQRESQQNEETRLRRGPRSGEGHVAAVVG